MFLFCGYRTADAHIFTVQLVFSLTKKLHNDFSQEFVLFQTLAVGNCESLELKENRTRSAHMVKSYRSLVDIENLASWKKRAVKILTRNL